ncbi:hypothetical protein C0416_05480 [bacterium]|nr:hypothetical protein [bacterium]
MKGATKTQRSFYIQAHFKANEISAPRLAKKNHPPLGKVILFRLRSTNALEKPRYPKLIYFLNGKTA